jgi:hypothetical protein
MNSFFSKSLITLFVAVLFPFINLTAQKVSISQLKFISEYEITHNLSFKGTTVGGLSGIDYDKEKKVYYLISDDRSAINPARFYTAKIYFTPKKIDSVAFIDVTNFLTADNKPYPNSKQDPAHTPDPEALRFNPITKQMFWTSEGERIVNKKDTVLENPSITVIHTNGKYIDTFPLPENLKMKATEKGPRQNGTLEGLTFADNFKTLFVNLEEPLFEDGPRADVQKNGAWIRIYKYDVATKKNTAQYAYELDPVAYPAVPENAFKINGIPDILSIGNDQLLVMERSYSSGRFPCTIKVYLVNLADASNIIHTTSLKESPAAHPLIKKLLLNMDDLKMYTDNIEGMTFGPDLPNGHKTLIFIADNNFTPIEKSQVMLFEVIP